MSFSFAMTWLGLLLILHAAFSCQQYRTLVASMPSASIPPSDVVAEVGLGFVLCFLGQLLSAGSSVQPIVGPQHKTLVAPPYQTRDFDKYHHRLHLLRKQ